MCLAIAFVVMLAGGCVALVEVDMDVDRLAHSPLPCKVCPNCAAYYLHERCASCGWVESGHECPPTGVPCGVCEIHSGGSSDDDSDPDDTDFAPTQPEPLDMSDPPGGEQ